MGHNWGIIRNILEHCSKHNRQFEKHKRLRPTRRVLASLLILPGTAMICVNY